MKDKILLYGVGGEMAGKIFELDNTVVVIGRKSDECSMVFSDDAIGVSGIHCQVKAVYPYLEIMDLGSRYGTFYENGERMQENVTYTLGNSEAFYIGEKANRFIVKIK